MISRTHPQVCAFKPNLAFYEARGSAGIASLERIMDYLSSRHPGIPVIGDAKRADIGSTSGAYARFLFDRLGFDAVTLNPWLGRDALRPFLDREDRGCIILCRTSNPGADDLQTVMVEGEPLWQRLARMVAQEWNTLGNCLLVMGATRPDDLRIARRLVGDMTFLAPGVGAQGGDLEAVLEAGLNGRGTGADHQQFPRHHQCGRPGRGRHPTATGDQSGQGGDLIEPGEPADRGKSGVGVSKYPRAALDFCPTIETCWRDKHACAVRIAIIRPVSSRRGSDFENLCRDKTTQPTNEVRPSGRRGPARNWATARRRRVGRGIPKN